MPAQLQISKTHCLTPEVVAEFESGNLSDEDLEAIEQHLAQCEYCETFLNQSLGADHALADRLRDCFELGPVIENDAVALLQGRAVGSTALLLGLEKQAIFHEAPPLTEVLIGTRVGDTLIEEMIGRGGMGIVFKGYQQTLRRPAAVKFIRTAFPEPHIIARFRNEAAAVARLRHPNVAQLYDYAEHQGLPYLVMEYVAGESLAATLRRGPLPPRHAAEIVRAIAAAVAYTHQQKVVHRDLKPSNILLDPSGEPKIVDFGLAKLADEQMSLTGTDVLMGTPAYMAPELLNGSKNTSGELVDIYALGAIFYEALTGVPPFQGSDRLDTLRRIRDESLAFPSKHQPRLPRGLEAICLKCMDKAPTRRYQSAQALADDLGLWLSDQRPRGIPGAAARLSRRLRRHRLTLMLVAALTTTAIAVFPNDPDRPLKLLQADLVAQKPVTLIDGKGAAAWYRCWSGEKTTKIASGDNGAFTVHAADYAMIELLPDSASDHYRIQAQVRHERANDRGLVGLYFGYRAYPVPQENPVEVFHELYFDDVRRADEMKIFVAGRQLPPAKNRVGLRGYIGQDRDDPPRIGCNIGLAAGKAFEPSGEREPRWRDVQIDVSPRGVSVKWEDDAYEVAAALIAKQFDFSLRGMKTDHPRKADLVNVEADFKPRGKLGLAVNRGSASFRSVKVIPLTEGSK